MLSADGEPFSFLSWEAAGKPNVDSGLESPNEKPPTEDVLFSSLPGIQFPGSEVGASPAGTAEEEEPPPNLNPPLLADMSDKVPPNLNPPEEEEEDSEEEAPNLNPPAEADEESVRVPPNWKPAPEVDSDDAPNLNPPEPESDDTPKEEEPKAESQERRERGERESKGT